MLEGFSIAANGKPIIYIDLQRLVNIEKGIANITIGFETPKPTSDFSHIQFGSLGFDPNHFYCGTVKSTLYGYNYFRTNLKNVDFLSSALTTSYIFMSIYSSFYTGGSIIWGAKPPIVSLFELAYLVNECKELMVNDLDRFMGELNKKIGKTKEGNLGRFQKDLENGRLSPLDAWIVNEALHSKVSEARVALMYAMAGKDVYFNTGRRGGGSDLIVINGSREVKIEVTSRFSTVSNFPFDVRRPFPQSSVPIYQNTISLDFFRREKGKLMEEFLQGEIVVEDLTNDYNLGFPLGAHGNLFPALKGRFKDAMEEAFEILEQGGKPVIFFASGPACHDNWICIDFIRL